MCTANLSDSTYNGICLIMNGTYIQVLMNLILVIGLILVYLGLSHWLSKKKNGKAKPLELVATLSLGSKEKIIIVKADNEKFLLGVTQHNISLLSSINATENSFEEVMEDTTIAKQKSESLI